MLEGISGVVDLRISTILFLSVNMNGTLRSCDDLLTFKRFSIAPVSSKMFNGF